MSRVEVETADGIALVTLRRPERSNAFDPELIAGLGDAIAEVARMPETRVAILTGSGATFSAGGDLDYFAAQAATDPMTPPVTAMRSQLEQMANSERVWIAAVNGAAVGGGLELALACHLRLAAERATFSMRHRNLGLAPGWGGGERLFDAVGVSAGLWLLLTASTLSAAEALRIGLVHRVLAESALLDGARALAREIAASPQGAIAGYLRLAAGYRA
ncbi:MAG TPA: enoyl-CoA hydratase/isomerase family protein, partial [Candidatus Udaeobacter sp.]|nr:enoyl-CoA hydratase/isomerase family protein [Candidatus Udaeobacter sp.]